MSSFLDILAVVLLFEQAASILFELNNFVTY